MVATISSTLNVYSPISFLHLCSGDKTNLSLRADKLSSSLKSKAQVKVSKEPDTEEEQRARQGERSREQIKAEDALLWGHLKTNKLTEGMMNERQTAEMKKARDGAVELMCQLNYYK